MGGKLAEEPVQKGYSLPTSDHTQCCVPKFLSGLAL